MTLKNGLPIGAVLVSILALVLVLFGGSRTVPLPGATPTLDSVDNPYVTINGQEEWHGKIAMQATSSVVCSFKNPWTATSTPVFPITLKVASSTIGTQNLFISTSTTASASSTVAWSNALAVTTLGQVSFVFNGNVATTTTTNAGGTGDANVLPGFSSVGQSLYFLKSGEYLNIKVGTSTAGTFSNYMDGDCSAVFRKA